jgi:hypothetical protein
VDILLRKPGKMVVQCDTSDHKIYFSMNSGGVSDTLVVKKTMMGITALHVHKDRDFRIKKP